MLQFKHKKNEKNVQIVQREVRMKKLLYRPKDAWVGDLIPYYENGTFYGYYLHDPRIRDKEYAEETTWHVLLQQLLSHSFLEVCTQQSLWDY